jgi:hypothetical protein
MTMAGMLSTVTRWDRFQEEWPVFLKRHGVSILHMTDFVSSKGEFREWAGKENSVRRKRFIEKAVACVKKHAKRGFVSTLPLADFDEANAKYCVEENMGAPLTICGMGIIRQVALWALDHRVNPKQIIYFMEDGDEDKKNFIAKARSYDLNVQPLTRKECCVFQASDMAAWKFNNSMRNAINKRGGFAEIDGSLEPMRPIFHDDKAVDRRIFLEHCRKKLPRR